MTFPWKEIKPGQRVKDSSGALYVIGEGGEFRRPGRKEEKARRAARKRARKGGRL